MYLQAVVLFVPPTFRFRFCFRLDKKIINWLGLGPDGWGRLGGRPGLGPSPGQLKIQFFIEWNRPKTVGNRFKTIRQRSETIRNGLKPSELVPKPSEKVSKPLKPEISIVLFAELAVSAVKTNMSAGERSLLADETTVAVAKAAAPPNNFRANLSSDFDKAIPEKLRFLHLP